MEGNSAAMFSIKEVPGKGKGMIANQKIAKGTRILAEKAILKIEKDSLQKANLLKKMFKTLPKPDQKAALALQNRFGGKEDKYAGIVLTNVILFGDDKDYGGLFLVASRVNHSCVPNSHGSWNENIEQVTIHANRDIEAGEEITLNYLARSGDFIDRKEQLFSCFGVECSCELCSLPEEERKKSDERRAKIRMLENQLPKKEDKVMVPPLEHLSLLRRILVIRNEEGVIDMNASLMYYDASQIVATHSDSARSVVFVKKAYEEIVILEGEDSPNAMKYHRLAQRPLEQSLYGFTSDWKTTVSDIPTNLKQDAFENWLWRDVPVPLIKSGAIECANLRDKILFPDFENLGAVIFAAEGHNKKIDDGTETGPRKYWCLITQPLYVEVGSPHIVVRDISNNIADAALDADQVRCDTWIADVKAGYTNLHLCGGEEDSDSTVDEDGSTGKTLSIPLNELLDLGDRVWQYCNVRDNQKICHACESKASTHRACAGCGFFWYCNKDCQSRGWKEKAHQKDCKLLQIPLMKVLFMKDWSQWEKC